MNGLMMDYPLTLNSLMKHGKKLFSNSEIVSITRDLDRSRYTFLECFTRAAQLANALEELGVQANSVLGTLAWNDHRHMEIYYGVGCSGSVCHTINPRLFPEQLIYIINHAEDEYIFVDLDFVPLLEKISDKLPNVKGYIVLCNEQNMPNTTLDNVYCYERLLQEQPTEYCWPELDENQACSMCYTSGTTGNPKGVLYSHRSIVLQSYACCLSATMGLSNQDVVMALVPMFHVNAWNLPYSAALSGFKLVLPGAKMGDPATIQSLIEDEKVSYSAGVPTIWLGLLAYLAETGKKVESLSSIIVGGAACPLSVMETFEEKYGVYTHVAWGMTELAPLGTFNRLKRPRESYSNEEYTALRTKAGVASFGIEMKIEDEQGKELPRDGKAYGGLKVRGPWVVARYFKQQESALDDNGWFDTGDVATIDSDGYMNITDRTKDVIKSGGEWISSIDLENCAMGHAEVAEAGVIGVSHPKWNERPLLVVVKTPGSTLQEEVLLDYMQDKVAKWWLPDAVVFVEKLPHTATGKISKLDLRKQFVDFVFPEN